MSLGFEGRVFRRLFTFGKVRRVMRLFGTSRGFMGIITHSFVHFSDLLLYPNVRRIIFNFLSFVMRPMGPLIGIEFTSSVITLVQIGNISLLRGFKLSKVVLPRLLFDNHGFLFGNDNICFTISLLLRRNNGL